MEMMPPEEKEENSLREREDRAVSLTMPRQTLFGARCLSSVGETVAGLGTRAFLITGPGSGQSQQLTGHVCSELRRYRIEPTTFRLTDADPDIAMVDSAAEACVKAQCDVVMGLGQAGVVAAAKLVSILGGHGADSIRPFIAGERSIEVLGLPLVGIPTVAVTGAEVTATAFVMNEENKVKWHISHPYLMPESVIIDPELTLSASPRVSAAAGMSAFAFAVEAFVSLKSNELTDTFAVEAMRLIGQNLPCAVRDSTDMDAKTALCLAGYLAGVAATGAGLGVADLLAPALQMALGTLYGEAVAMLLPASVAFNLDHARDKYGRVAALLPTARGPGAESLPELLATFLDDIGINDTIARLRMDYGIIEETLSAIGKSGARAETNPRPVDRAGLVRILRRAREHVQRRNASRQFRP